jgi:hypothetical protein
MDRHTAWSLVNRPASAGLVYGWTDSMYVDRERGREMDMHVYRQIDI